MTAAAARSTVVGGGKRPATEVIVDGALRLAVRDEDADGIVELLADALLASLEASDRGTAEVGQ